MTPRIGISILENGGDPSGALSRRIRKDLCESIRTAGGQPIIVLAHEAGYSPQGLLDSIDALIISGVEAGRPETENAPRGASDLFEQSFLEIRLANLAIQNEVPFLALSSGMNLVNALFGGSAFEDLSSDCDVIYDHFHITSPHEVIHSIVIEPESRLFEILDTDNISINSMHRRGVNRPGSGLIVSARSADGIIEGLELPDEEVFLVCVQGCPEAICAGAEARWLRLFKSIVSAGARFAENNSMDFQANSR